MKCDYCAMWWVDASEEYPTCHADPKWPAPCEYDEDDNDDSY